MKKLLFLFAALFALLTAHAQEAVTFRYGCVSYEEVLKVMPEYANIDADMAVLKQKFDAETKASEEEFNAKYVTFLNEQKNYAPSILRKRQSELEDLMRRNEQFRTETRRLLDEARAEMVKGFISRIDAAVAAIATQYSLAFVLNTDSEAVPYLNVSMAYNITEAVKQTLTVQQEQ